MVDGEEVDSELPDTGVVFSDDIEDDYGDTDDEVADSFADFGEDNE